MPSKADSLSDKMKDCYGDLWTSQLLDACVAARVAAKLYSAPQDVLAANCAFIWETHEMPFEIPKLSVFTANSSSAEIEIDRIKQIVRIDTRLRQEGLASFTLLHTNPALVKTPLRFTDIW